jgi:hypothetical protein
MGEKIHCAMAKYGAQLEPASIRSRAIHVEVKQPCMASPRPLLGPL